MTKFKKLGAFAVASVMTVASVFSLAACGSKDSETDNENDVPEIIEKEVIVPTTFDVDEQLKGSDWRLINDSFGEYNVSYYTVENIVYCTNPTHPQNQSMRFYVPAAYLNEDGTLNKENTVNGYTSETAPIIYINNCSGYVGDPPWQLTSIFRLAGVNSKYYGWYYNYLQNGFVLVFVGERGKQTVDENKGVIGVSPVSLADLKAGVRYLKYNDAKLPGDADKIISNGVSAGGNMSALLGVTGNSTLYDPWLKDMGAYMGEDADDSVFATQAYCPITDLDHAALAYEWMWQGDETTGAMSDFLKDISALMAAKYATYINDLELVDEEGNPLTLSTDGSQSGTFYEWLKGQYEESFSHYVDLTNDLADTNTYSWLSYDAATKTASISSIKEMIESSYNPRQKGCISFDQVDGLGDNAVFGIPGATLNTSDSRRHYTPDLPELFDQLKDKYPTECEKYYNAYLADVTNEEVLSQIYYYNPYHFIIDKINLAAGEEPTEYTQDADLSEHFRINVGTKDRDTSPTVSAVYALLLQKAGYDVEYNLIWNEIHIDADLEGEFEAWVNSICK